MYLKYRCRVTKNAKIYQYIDGGSIVISREGHEVSQEVHTTVILCSFSGQRYFGFTFIKNILDTYKQKDSLICIDMEQTLEILKLSPYKGFPCRQYYFFFGRDFVSINI